MADPHAATRRVECDGKSVRWVDAQGETHRPDGPAFDDQNGYMEWVWHGVLHRLGGPAVVDEPSPEPGVSLNEWWINGQHYDDHVAPFAVQRYCALRPDCPTVRSFRSASE